MVVKACGRVPVSVYIVGESTVDGQVGVWGLGSAEVTGMPQAS